MIEAVGHKPRYKKILLTFSSKGVKREILNIVNSKFSHKYKAWTLEEDETAVTLSEVPHKMTDATLREALGKYGVLDPAPTVMHKCDLGFFNLTRSLVFTDLKYDIPSVLKIGGYSVQPRYTGQPKTCHLCNSRDHVADDCPNNTRKALKIPVRAPELEQPREKSMVDRIAQAVEESVNNIKHQKGVSVNSPQFKEMVQKQLERFEETATKRQERRYRELRNQSSGNLGVNSRKRSNIDDESDGRDKKGSKKRQDSDGFTKVLGRYPKNSKESRVPPDEHDFYDGMPSVSDN